MGQNGSTQKVSEKQLKKNINPLIISAFGDMSKGQGKIDYESFKNEFGLFLTPYLWKYFQSIEGSNEIDLETFSQQANSLIGMSTDIYVKILGSPDALLNACFEAANIDCTEEDNAFLESLKSDMKFEVVKSDILRPVEMYFLISCLPTTVFFPPSNEHDVNQSTNWTKLYSSYHHGISINRFVSNVFQYKGSTICIFYMTSHETFVVASDHEWRNSVNKYGGPNTMLFRFKPTFCHFNLNEKPIYSNFKLRSGVFGLSIDRHFSIDSDMNNVREIEAWGCGGTQALEKQKKIRLREKLQAERNKKVPLPGKWDDNPDKAIMEMAGYEFSTEKKHESQSNN